MSEHPVTVRFPLQWGEMDALGHANNTRFFAWFESSRVAYLERVGLGATPGGVGPILASTTCDYQRPVVYPAKLEVGSRVARIGRTSMVFEHVVWELDDEGGRELRATGEAVVVTVAFPEGRPVPVPEPVRQAIEALEGDRLKG